MYKQLKLRLYKVKVNFFLNAKECLSTNKLCLTRANLCWGWF